MLVSKSVEVFCSPRPHVQPTPIVFFFLDLPRFFSLTSDDLLKISDISFIYTSASRIIIIVIMLEPRRHVDW